MRMFDQKTHHLLEYELSKLMNKWMLTIHLVWTDNELHALEYPSILVLGKFDGFHLYGCSGLKRWSSWYWYNLWPSHFSHHFNSNAFDA